MTDTLEFAAQLARQAGDLLQDYFNPAGTTATRKADSSLVTEADIAADHLIASAIQARYPQDVLLSEELQSTLPEADRPTWVVDPLDGTTNFSLGLHVWGVSIARLTGGQPELAALYYPLLGELYTARWGSGAYLNGLPIQARDPNPTQSMSFFACCSRTPRRYHVSVPYKARILGSASYTLCMVARGTALAGFEVKTKAWDIAGGWLLVQEAGGVITCYSDAQPFPLTAGSDYSKINYTVLAAANPEILSATRQQLTPKER